MIGNRMRPPMETIVYHRNKKSKDRVSVVSSKQSGASDTDFDQENEDFIAEFLTHQALDQLERDAGVVVEKEEEEEEDNGSGSGSGGQKKPAPKRRNYVQRIILGTCLISLLSTIVYLGRFAMVIFVTWIYLTALHELLSIGFVVFNFKNSRSVKRLGWAYVLVTLYFNFGLMVERRLPVLKAGSPLVSFVMSNHLVIVMVAYATVTTLYLRKSEAKELTNRLSLLAYIILGLLVWTGALNHIENTLDGMIWFVYPVSLSVFNDIMAYAIGQFMGRTPLIELSPKKTWEGFIGSAFSTLIFSFYLASVMGSSLHLTCPVEFAFDANNQLYLKECQPRPLFQPRLQTFTAPRPFDAIFPAVQVTMSAFQWHGFMISLFVSFLSPFGGFFASGFKRAFKIKDFGRLIPGHGGFNDRFDCNMYTAFFTIAYMNTFIQGPGPSKIYNQFLHLSAQDQADFLGKVKAQFLST